jgi:replicative DNA helicase
MIKAIDALVTGKVCEKVKPALIAFDYLQAFPIDPEVSKESKKDQRNLQVREDFYRLRQLAALYKCPVIVAVQAKQELDDKSRNGSKLPGIYDAQETSAIAQRADRIISLWMPKITNLVGSEIEINGNRLKVEENMLFVKVTKQRGGLPSGQSWLCRIDFAKNEIAPQVK